MTDNRSPSGVDHESAAAPLGQPQEPTLQQSEYDAWAGVPWEHRPRAVYDLAAIEAEYDALLKPEMRAKLRADRDGAA